MKSYSQFGEDLILHREFFRDTEKGICIEVGAVDGVMMSNTLFFEERGWLCICIEANPFMFEDLKRIDVKLFMERLVRMMRMM